ncbi:MAG: hypothetical protein L6R19_15420 [Alphaproteobacteria bacterium]|nr:hypothetical protein [Alphaproteobacteria bacterium]
MLALALGAAVAPVALAARPALAQTVVHGADSRYASPTVKLAWAMVKGATEEETLVVLRLVNVAGAHRFVKADGVDPFTKNRAVFAGARAFADRIDLSIPRARFADFPSLELLLDADAEKLAPGRAALTVYYLGVPDTTPEFLSQADASAYLDKMLASAR